jgi:hypothetical protein
LKKLPPWTPRQKLLIITAKRKNRFLFTSSI